MIDLITLTMNGLSENEVNHIVETNRLYTNTRNGRVFYDNMEAKNIRDRFYLRIETNKRLKLECSLHKYNTFLETGKYINFDLFTMSQAVETASQLTDNTGITPEKLNVYSFEIGMNLVMSKDCREYLDRMRAIGILDNKREFAPNQKYKDKRVIITPFHREIKKVYKAYDKAFEMNDKKRIEHPKNVNILRIETVYRRVEKMPFTKFFTIDYLGNLIKTFERDWRSLEFDIELSTPKGTTGAKIELCKSLIKRGKEAVLQESKHRNKSGLITDKQYRTIREFITHEWDSFKRKVKVIQGTEEQEFREKVRNTLVLLNS